MQPLTDSHHRIITNLRISITDRCNLRCIYCMPANPEWLPRPEILTFEEIVRVARIAIGLGVNRIRLTGGEPTARHGLTDLVKMLLALPGMEDLSLTTNGLLLKQYARPLCEAGLKRINISLDTMNGERFKHITRREAFPQVWEGIAEAERVGFSPLKINMVVMRDTNEDEVAEFARLAREHAWQVRFIEFMPLDGDNLWSRDKVVSAREILERVSAVGDLEPMTHHPSDPARLYRFKDGRGDIGLIASVTEPFCGSCDRIRLTADGKVRTCLFSIRETDIKEQLRGGAADEDIAETIRNCVMNKEPGHMINLPGFVKPGRAMYSIGG